MDHGVKCHVTVNTMPRNDEIARLPEYLEQLDDAGVDALIVADLGRIHPRREICPPLRKAHFHPAVHRQLRLRPGVV